MPTATPLAADTSNGDAKATVNAPTGLDGAADSSIVVGSSKERRKKAKKERKRELAAQKKRKGYLTPEDVQSPDPVKQFTTL